MPTWIDKILNSQSVQLALAALAFLIAFWLVIVIARMLMGGRLRLPGGRTRQARLGIVDAFDLDRQRQLIIVRRDNTEHLIMIGGPNDLVIESEIVRVEARDFRDSRRDKLFDSSSDARIPAPFGVPGEAQDGSAPRQDEPMLPMPLPQAATAEVPSDPAVPPAAGPAPVVAEPARSRGPTFPLPPRRPVAPAPERRPPPLLPERVSRSDEPPPVPSTPLLEGPATPLVAPDAVPPAPAAKSEAPQPADVATLRPTPPARPAPFKPLPPRPPLRPLKRVTPQAEPAAPPAPAAEPPSGGSQDTVAAPQPAAPPRPTPPPVAAPTAASPQPAPSVAPPASGQPPAVPAADADALESLEAEMAKLLGRG